MSKLTGADLFKSQCSLLNVVIFTQKLRFKHTIAILINSLCKFSVFFGLYIFVIVKFVFSNKWKWVILLCILFIPAWFSLFSLFSLNFYLYFLEIKNFIQYRMRVLNTWMMMPTWMIPSRFLCVICLTTRYNLIWNCDSDRKICDEIARIMNWYFIPVNVCGDSSHIVLILFLRAFFFQYKPSGASVLVQMLSVAAVPNYHRVVIGSICCRKGRSYMHITKG